MLGPVRTQQGLVQGAPGKLAGVTAFVARYRLGPRYRHPAMRDDALRAVTIQFPRS